MVRNTEEKIKEDIDRVFKIFPIKKRREPRIVVSPFSVQIKGRSDAISGQKTVVASDQTTNTLQICGAIFETAPRRYHRRSNPPQLLYLVRY